MIVVDPNLIHAAETGLSSNVRTVTFSFVWLCFFICSIGGARHDPQKIG